MRRVLCLLIFPTLGGFAQQDPQFTHYMFNNLYYNPGYAGVEGVPRATALVRSQWSGYQPTYYGGGAPMTELVSYSSNLPKIKSGIGGYLLNDKLGPQTNIEVQASYAYHFRIKTGKLSLGIRAGIYSQAIDTRLYKAIHENDPYLPATDGKLSQTKPDVAVGAFYRNDKYYFGVGLSHLNRAKFDFNLGQENNLEPHLYITGGYFYELNFDTKIQFVTLVKSDFVKTQYDLGAIAYLRNTIWGGLSFRQSEAAIVLIGWSFLKDKTLKAGYSMDIIVKDQAAKQPLSHELMISYDLPIAPGVGKKVVRTPRYRH